ncbi:hypothetical protein LL033_00095 [Clostridium estertheticum]|nr:hypothetical protein [Clostridium estertheticum]MBU3215037.1 hypothetical protein [Clostridium estertheticum]WAG55672.1 hypothetical protein LL033_00095 [Clostridium estertheticum]
MSLKIDKDSSITIIKSRVVKLTDDKREEKFQQTVQEFHYQVSQLTH